MPMLEPPVVTTRPPPSESPDLPASPLPSVNGGATPLEALTRAQSPEQLEAHPGGSGTLTPSVSYEPPAPSQDSHDQDHPREEDGRLRRRARPGRRDARWRELLKECKLVLTLENSGSVARDHLASERTFLAYARTSLTIASTGVALVQLFTLSAATVDKDMERFARPLGAVMIILGLLTLVIGVMRYFLIQNALIRGVYPVARISPTILSAVLLLVVIVVFVIIVVAG